VRECEIAQTLRHGYELVRVLAAHPLELARSLGLGLDLYLED
jgi:hypothetical protein